MVSSSTVGGCISVNIFILSLGHTLNFFPTEVNGLVTLLYMRRSQRCGLCQNFKQTTLTTIFYNLIANSLSSRNSLEEIWRLS